VEYHELENEVDSTVVAEPHRNAKSPKRWFQFRLWMLLALVVPVALWTKFYLSDPRVYYSEAREQFYDSGLTDLDFEKDPQGVDLKNRDIVDRVYESLGVSFAFGTPWRERETESKPLATVVTKSDVDSVEVGKQFAASDYGKAIKGYGEYLKRFGEYQKKTDEESSAVVVSGYRILSSNYPNSIACFRSRADRFRGPMTIRFHKPDEPDKPAGVWRVGFWAGRLNNPDTLEVRLYGVDESFLGKQTNAGTKSVFMCFESNRRIGRIEIEAIGYDKDYAITGLMFDKLK